MPGSSPPFTPVSWARVSLCSTSLLVWIFRMPPGYAVRLRRVYARTNRDGLSSELEGDPGVAELYRLRRRGRSAVDRDHRAKLYVWRGLRLVESIAADEVAVG